MVIGILNYLLSRKRDRVNLKSFPAWGYRGSSGSQGKPDVFAISVANRSAFPITVRNFGIWYHGSQQMSILQPGKIDGVSQVPRELKARESFVSVWHLSEFGSFDLEKAKCFFVETDCDERISFGRRQLQQMRAQYQAGEPFEGTKIFGLNWS
jgi:hypothetical protein